MCAGLALGLRASQLALRILGTDPERNDLIVAVETDTCSVDAIQTGTACTFGNAEMQPARPLVTRPVVCDGCGEATMAHRGQEQTGGTVPCVACGQRRVNLIGPR